jgi:hypothetical protein
VSVKKRFIFHCLHYLLLLSSTLAWIHPHCGATAGCPPNTHSCQALLLPVSCRPTAPAQPISCYVQQPASYKYTPGPDISASGAVHVRLSLHNPPCAGAKSYGTSPSCCAAASALAPYAGAQLSGMGPGCSGWGLPGGHPAQLPRSHGNASYVKPAPVGHAVAAAPSSKLPPLSPLHPPYPAVAAALLPANCPWAAVQIDQVHLHFVPHSWTQHYC